MLNSSLTDVCFLCMLVYMHYKLLHVNIQTRIVIDNIYIHIIGRYLGFYHLEYVIVLIIYFGLFITYITVYIFIMYIACCHVVSILLHIQFEFIL